MLILLKSAVRAYTKRDGTFVAAHADKRTARERARGPVDQGDLFTNLRPPPPPPLVPPPGPKLLYINPVARTETEGVPDFADYKHVLVMFSGGKDSIASVVKLLEDGCPKDKIELWHHDIDGGAEGSFMDWPVTPAYCRAFAKALGVPIYFSHREGGFEREMNRDAQNTAAVVFDKPDGTQGRAGGVSTKLGTRLKFPQVSADLSVRWCSGALKVDVGAAAIRNQERFADGKTLVVTGERAQESSNRAKYKVLEPDRTNTQSRSVDHYRPIHGHSEEQVWGAMQRHGIVPHPSYQLGYSRLSCRNCIFGSPAQWATNRALFPDSFKKVADYEKSFGTTIHRTDDIGTRADKGTPFEAAMKQPELARMADGRVWDQPILVNPRDWKLPAGAYGTESGPT